MGFSITGPAELPTYTGNKTITGTLTVSTGPLICPYFEASGGGQGFYATGSSGRLHLPSNGGVMWSTTTSGGGNDSRLNLESSATGSLVITNPGNGQALGIPQLTELTTIAAAATTDTAIQIPINALVIGVSVRVTTVIPTAATFTVTGTTSGTTFSTAAVAVAANTTDVGTANCIYKNGAAQTIRITPDVQPAANTGRVRVTIHYLLITPATS